MKRVVLTGATGFVGAHAIPALQARGFQVHVLGRRAPAAAGLVFHEMDLLDVRALPDAFATIRARHLLHLAWYAEPGQYWRSPANLDWVAASLALVRGFREAGGGRAVVAGTCAEYAWGPGLLSEFTSASEPATLYGAAKDGTRRIVQAYATESGLSVAWARLFFLYGPGEKPGRLVGDAIRALQAGRRFGASHGSHRRDFIHVADAAAALAAVLDGEATGPINVGSGNAVSVRDVLERIGRLTRRGDLIDFGARTAGDEPPCVEADVTRLGEEVGFRPRFDLDGGLRELVAGTGRSVP